MTGMRVGAVPLVAVLLAILLASGSATAFETSEITAAGDSAIDRSPSISETGGTLMTAWLAYDGSGADIMYRVRSQGTWGAPGKLTDGAGSERDVATCSSNGRIYAAWATDSPLYTDGADWDIALSMYTPGGGWSSPVELSALNDTANDYAPFLLPYQDGVVVLWQSIEGSAGHIQLVSYTSSASVPFAVTDTWKEMNQNPTAAFLGDALWVAWSSNDPAHTDGGDLDIVAASCDIQGRSLSQITQLSDPADTEDDLYPSMLALNGKLHIAWQTKDKTAGAGSDEDVALAVYSGGWTTHPLSSSHDTGDDTYPLLFSSGDDLWIAWQSSDPALTGDADWDIVVAPVNGTALGNAIVVSEGKDPADQGGTAVRGHGAIRAEDGILVLWETTSATLTDGTDRDIVMASLPQPGQDKVDGGGGPDIPIIPVFVIAGFLGGVAIFLVFRRTHAKRKR